MNVFREGGNLVALSRLLFPESSVLIGKTSMIYVWFHKIPCSLSEIVKIRGTFEDASVDWSTNCSKMMRKLTVLLQILSFL